jgi:hypothetical protein
MQDSTITIIPMEAREIGKTEFCGEVPMPPPYTIEQRLQYQGRIIHFCVSVPKDGDAVFYLDGIAIDINSANEITTKVIYELDGHGNIVEVTSTHPQQPPTSPHKPQA